jgi:hypothetical protein
VYRSLLFQYVLSRVGVRECNMRPGIRVTGESVGTGDEATKGKTVIINMRLGPTAEADSTGEVQSWRRKVDLARRDADAGLRYGVEGMRVGGRRAFMVSPSLAGGNRPVGYEVELLEVRDGPYMTPEEYPPGRSMQIIHPGEMSRLLPKWNFGLQEDGGYGLRITVPIPGLKWRHARGKMLSGSMDAARATAMLAWVVDFPAIYPAQAVSDVVTWGGDSSFYLTPSKEVVCIAVQVWERGKYVARYYVPETSAAWNHSEVQIFATGLIAPILGAGGRGVRA